MNLLLRLWNLIFWSRFAPRLNLLDESVICFRVYPWDLDLNRHMTNSRYTSLMDLGRLDLSLRGPYGVLFRRRQWQSVLGSITLRFRQPLHLFQSFQVKTRLIGWDEKWLFIEQKIVHQGEVKCVALAKGLLLKKGKPIRVERILGPFAAEQHLPSVQLTPVIEQWLAFEEASRTALQREQEA